MTASIAPPSRSGFAPCRRASRTAVAVGACMAALCVALLTPPGAHDAWTVVLLVVLAPVLEEVVFRAGLQESLLRRGLAPVWTNVLCAAAFAVLHGLTRSWLLAAWVIPPALLLGALYARTRTLGAVVALHAAMNFIWLWAGPGWTGLSSPTSL
jgi:membrane protease YdiL (CAAX protease family)